MRPLQAHCHLGLGTLHAKLGRLEQARAELSAAITMYRSMEMTFWPPRRRRHWRRWRGGDGFLCGGRSSPGTPPTARTVSYRALKVQFHLDDEQLDALRKNGSTHTRRIWRRMGGASYGLEERASCQHRPQRAGNQCRRLNRWKRHLRRANPHQPPRVYQTPSAASSRCCSATS